MSNASQQIVNKGLASRDTPHVACAVRTNSQIPSRAWRTLRPAMRVGYRPVDPTPTLALCSASSVPLPLKGRGLV